MKVGNSAGPIRTVIRKTSLPHRNTKRPGPKHETPAKHQTKPYVVTAAPRDVIELRRDVIGYVTQFLRVIPRVPAEMVVAEPMMDRGIAEEQALARARMLLERLNIPKRLWHLSPMTFSGGEQQRVNIARGFAAHFPILLLDEPTASLDTENRNRVLELIAEAQGQGSAILAVFHDENERRRACSRSIRLD